MGLTLRVVADIATRTEIKAAFEGFITGLFVILPQPQINKLGPWRFPIAFKRPVMVLSKRQFVVWNALSVGWGLMDIFDDVAFGGIPYKLPEANCITWTDRAVVNALLVGAVPF